MLEKAVVGPLTAENPANSAFHGVAIRAFSRNMPGGHERHDGKRRRGSRIETATGILKLPCTRGFLLSRQEAKSSDNGTVNFSITGSTLRIRRLRRRSGEQSSKQKKMQTSIHE